MSPCDQEGDDGMENDIDNDDVNSMIRRVWK